MKLFVTSKNTGPSWNSDPTHLLGISTTLDQAIEYVGDFVKYEKEYGTHDGDWVPTTIPNFMKPTLIKYYMADGWWFSVVGIEVN